MTKKLYSFMINEAEARGLQMMKAADGIAVSELIRQAIRDYLDRHGVMWRHADRADSLNKSPQDRGVR